MFSRPLIRFSGHLSIDVLTGSLQCVLTSFDRNISLSESVIGMYASRERFTRSNSYFEVSVSREGGEGKVGLLIGCLYDLLYDDRNPMESTSDVGGMVDGYLQFCNIVTVTSKICHNFSHAFLKLNKYVCDESLQP